MKTRHVVTWGKCSAKYKKRCTHCNKFFMPCTTNMFVCGACKK